ncbi:hypothetical protein ACH44C_07995 [Streptomyces purpureus]|uniref:hypothetical protein n=1 Tax=Streptomyces purpureus TaxID=1951 RepID=UPI00378A301A
MTRATRRRRLPAGLEAAAAALLDWLADPAAPRLCLVGGGGRRRSAARLLDWLARQGDRGGAARERAIHARVPLEGQSALGAAWLLADRLGVVAREPGELVRILATDPRRTVVVLPGLHQAAEPGPLTELVAALGELGHLRLVVEAPVGTDVHASLAALRPTVLDLDPERRQPEPPAPVHELPDLDDPAAVCAADPFAVTAAYGIGHGGDDHGGDDHGGLRQAWLRAGQSLCRDQTPADRALVLLAALGDGADPRLRPALAELAAPAPWRVDWARVRGDLTPPWPGPVVALAVGAGPSAGRLLAADQLGTVRLLNAEDATPAGLVPAPPARRARALAALPDGSVLFLDERGRLHAEHGTQGPSATRRLTEAVAATLARHPGSALAAAEDIVLVGDRMGSVHAFGLTDVHQAALHSGRVTAVGVVGTPAPLVHSGGADGTVRAWAPGRAPLAVPAAERPFPVVALHAAHTPAGVRLAVAWGDGLVELYGSDGGAPLGFRPGPPVRAVAVTADGAVVIGMDEALLRLTPGH